MINQSVHDTGCLARLVLIGDPPDTRALLSRLPDGDYAVTLAPDCDVASAILHTPGTASLVVTVLNSGTTDLLSRLERPGQTVSWMAWNRHDHAALASEAYEHGALAVLPSVVTAEGLRAALRTAFARLIDRGERHRRAHGVVEVPEGARIGLDDDDVLTVERGVVATQVLHEDGTEVLIGLAGPGDVLTGHPQDSCCLHLSAHTAVRAVVQSWAHVATTPHFAERLRTHLRRADAWAAVQARPHLSDRLIGLLSVVAERFGRPHGDATLVDVRLTHAQLAAALGTTRATVTRVVGRLRRARILDRIGAGHAERFLLRIAERHRHA